MILKEKIDVLDIVIEVLVEHEKTLDSLIGRLEKTLTKMENLHVDS